MLGPPRAFGDEMIRRKYNAQYLRRWLRLVAVRISLISVVAAFLQPGIGFAQVFCDVQKIISGSTLDAGRPLIIRSGEYSASVRRDYLQSLLEVHKRLSGVSNVSARLCIAIDNELNATADDGRRLIVVTTAMLDLIFVALTLAFFTGAWCYARVCERL